MRISLSTLLIGLLALPGGASAEPSLAMMHQTGKGSAVVLANDDGSGQHAIYTSRDSGAFVRPGGLRSQHMMLLIQNNTVNLLHYIIGSKGPVVDSIKLLPIPNASVDFSPDGGKVFYFNVGTRTFRLYDLGSGATKDLAPLPTGYGAGAAVFARDGTSVLYYIRNISTSAVELYSVPVSGGTPVRVPISGNRAGPETALDGGFLVNNTTQTFSQFFIERYPNGGGTGTNVTPGTWSSFSCTDGSIFYQIFSGGSWSVMRMDLPLGSIFNVAGPGYYGPAALKPC